MKLCYNHKMLTTLLLVASSSVYANSGTLADTPEELINLISNAAFVPPEAYLERKRTALEQNSFIVSQRHIEQKLDEKTDPRNSITAADLKQWSNELVSFSLQSRDDGDILWGRVQGTKYERMGLDWAEAKLKSFGIDKVYHDTFPSGQEQWRPTVNELVITSTGAEKDFKPYTLQSAITAFESKNTPKDGIEGEVIYVGDGTPSELQGRELEGKIVLLRSRIHPSALMSTARVAFARISSGKWGEPAGVVVWFDVANAGKIAGRVGAPGGGDSIGGIMPWIGVGYEDGVYLRKLADRADKQHPLLVKMNVQGQMDKPEDRMSGNVYGVLPGKSGKYIIVLSHMDSYFYGLLDNATSVAKNLSLAKYYASMPEDKREHGIIFLFQGDHEVPGVGGTREFVKKWKTKVDEDLLIVLRSEHLGFIAPMDEGVITSNSNTTMPLLLTLTNQSPALIKVLEEAQWAYSLPSGDRVVMAPSIDEMAFYPPYFTPEKGNMPISTGWVQTGKKYHTYADVDENQISFDAVEKYSRAHAYIIDQLFDMTEADLRKDEIPLDTSKNLYQSDMVILTLGDW